MGVVASGPTLLVCAGTVREDREGGDARHAITGVLDVLVADRFPHVVDELVVYYRFHPIGEGAVRLLFQLRCGMETTQVWSRSIVVGEDDHPTKRGEILLDHVRFAEPGIYAVGLALVDAQDPQAAPGIDPAEITHFGFPVLPAAARRRHGRG